MLATRAGVQIHLLDTQYRMHPDISAFPNSYFYQNQVHDGENVRGPGRLGGSLVGELWFGLNFSHFV